MAKSPILLDHDIFYQTLPSNENQSTNDQKLTVAPLSRHKSGPLPASSPAPMLHSDKRADDEAINLISNSAVIDTPDKDIPDRYEFELIRLRRRIAELECIVRDRDDRIVKALGMIEDELSFWRTWLHDHIGETMAGISRRVGRLESSLEYLKEKGSRFYPPLEIPAAWKKKS